MCGVTKKERIRKSSTRDKEDHRERDKGHVLRRMLDAPVRGKIGRGRQKTRWKHSCNRDMESVTLKEDVLDRTKWKNEIQNHSGDSR